MLLKMRLDQNLDLGRTFQQNLKELTDEKETASFYKNCGGEDLVQSYIKLVQWWDNLSHDWQHKILNAPFKFIEEKLWFTLSQLNLEGLEQWYTNIIERSQESLHKKGNEILSPNIWKKVISEIRPKPKRIERILKLHQVVEQDNFEVLLNKEDYGFTPESLEEFKLEVFAGVNGEIFTESLFPYLKARELDPLAILSPRDRLRWEFEQQLQEKDKEIEQKLQEKDKEIEEVRSQLEQQLKERDQRIQELEEQNQQQQLQINTLMEEMNEFRKFMEASKAKDLTPVK